MDGSVSTLAPVFAAAFATKSSLDAFLVGLAASIGAGISMAFAEALSDDGALTGRGNPVIRGLVTGAMTTAGGIGHTLPYLIPEFKTAANWPSPWWRSGWPPSVGSGITTWKRRWSAPLCKLSWAAC